MCSLVSNALRSASGLITGCDGLLAGLAGHAIAGWLIGRLLPPRASLAARSSADERLDVAIMGKRRRRSSDVVFEDGVKVRGESMAGLGLCL